MGYNWIEVLAIVPFRFTMEGHCHSCGNTAEDGPFYLAQHIFYCRTEHGLTQICENDLMPEIEVGVYCEEGQEENARQRLESAKEWRKRRQEMEDKENDDEDEENDEDY